MKVVLISTYDLGHQPFGLASPAAWLRQAGHEVSCIDLALDKLPEEPIRTAEWVAFHLPMHTATRLAIPVIGRVKGLNPKARLCAYGLYAPLNEPYLRSLGIDTIIGAEFESVLAALPDTGGSFVPLDRLHFATPQRQSLPPLARYAHLHLNGARKTVGYTETTRGCKHLCRHCPVVPVYNGTFRVIQPDVVLNDIRQQVAAGAQHITFGDPDFWNGPTHGMRIVEQLHREFPSLTYDVTIKIEHLLQHRHLIAGLKQTGCLFVTSAVESVDDAVLEKLAKGHTRADFIEVARLFETEGLILAPTFIAFTPWTTPGSYRDLLATIAELNLIENVPPVQLALRLLIPAGSRLLELEDIQRQIGPFDDAALLYRWTHPDPAIDELAHKAFAIAAQRKSRRETFDRLWSLVSNHPLAEDPDRIARAAIPYLDEPWYC
ncbi:MAG TPA: CUAEP/CCAEP-tail radical SAM protein [Bryobacteraceae bacterium]|nr:CUAEP/CCAEP-tail radical SAM protein [Bryobacteraceae bacterium]